VGHSVPKCLHMAPPWHSASRAFGYFQLYAHSSSNLEAEQDYPPPSVPGVGP
jgi:hypothetical protein